MSTWPRAKSADHAAEPRADLGRDLLDPDARFQTGGHAMPA
jgi:hypothetical protein